MSDNKGDSGNTSKTGEQNKEMDSSNSRPSYASAPLTFRIKGDQITSASPPQQISLEEIMKAAHGLQKMALVHEIALERDFLLQPFQPPENSLERIVKDTMHKAFFDRLREELNSDPPVYRQALVLLQDVKQGLYSIIVPNDTRFNQVIEEVLDLDFIKQQAQNNAIDFNKYAGFVVDLMGKLCAPVRDDMVNDIKNMTDTVEIFRAILEALEVLKLDLANTFIARLRPHIQANSVEYEKEKFEQLLKVQDDGLQNTRTWLLRHLDLSKKPTSDETVVKSALANALVGAYLELLDWDDNNPYPETMQMDATRFAALSLQSRRVQIVAAICLLSPTVAPADPNLSQMHRKQLKERLNVLTQDVGSFSVLIDQLPNLSEEVIQFTNDYLLNYNFPLMDENTKELIRKSILSLNDEQHKVRRLVWQRILEFLRGVLQCGGGVRPVPPGLTTSAPELTALAGSLFRLVVHNKAVYEKYYAEIVWRALA